MKHKHAEMIKAKVDNMELVAFVKLTSMWSEMDDRSIVPTDVNFDYFLCLPQHKDACLHYLNGGDVLVKSNLVPSWAAVTHGQLWGKGIGWMREDAQYRIKPKKEKRWIVWDTAQSIPERESYKSLEDAMLNFDYPDAQFIEIEVEV